MNPEITFPLVYHLIGYRAWSITCKELEADAKNIPSYTDVESPKVRIALEMIELMGRSRLLNGEWSSYIIERLLLLEYEYLNGIKYTSLFDKSIAHVKEQARKQTIPMYLEQLYFYRRNKEMMVMHV